MKSAVPMKYFLRKCDRKTRILANSGFESLSVVLQHNYLRSGFHLASQDFICYQTDFIFSIGKNFIGGCGNPFPQPPLGSCFCFPLYTVGANCVRLFFPVRISIVIFFQLKHSIFLLCGRTQFAPTSSKPLLFSQEGVMFYQFFSFAFLILDQTNASAIRDATATAIQNIHMGSSMMSCSPLLSVPFTLC